MYKLLIFALLNLLALSYLPAQDIPYSSDHILNPFTQNAARAGNNNVLNLPRLSRAFIGYRNFWIGTSRPMGLAIGTFDTRVNRGNIGIGVTAFNHNSILINRTGLGLAYAYHVQLGRDSGVLNQLSLGIQANYLNQHINIGGLDVKHASDPALVNNLWSGNYFDIDFGATLRVFNLSIDVSSSNLLSSKNGVNPFYQEGVGFRPNFFGSIRYTALLKLGTSTKSLTFEPILATFVQPSYLTNIDLGHSLLYSNSKVDITLSWALQFQSRGPEDINAPIGIYTSIGIGMSSWWNLALLHEINTSSVRSPGSTVGIQATYMFPMKEQKEKAN